MTPDSRKRRNWNPFWRAMIEIGFIIFLFYSNLLMGEYTRSGYHGQTLLGAVRDMLTFANFVIANLAAFVGYGVVEFLRKKL